MVTWREMAIGDLGSPLGRAFATGPFGSSIGRKFFIDAGVPVIRGSNLSTDVGLRLIHDGMVFVSEEKAAQHRRSIAQPGDLVFTCWGTIGQVGFIDTDGPFQRYLISNKQMKMTPDPEVAVGLFLYYLMSSPQMMDAVQRQSIGAAVPGFNLGQLRKMRVRIPDVPTQHRIAAFLCAFDELIEINGRRIELLEGIATSLYREWFVRFRFPGRENADLTESPLGLIPSGWRVARLADVARLVMGQSPKSEFYNREGQGMPFHQGVTDYGTLLPTHRVFSTAGSRLAEVGDVVCSVRAPVGRLNLADQRLILGRGLASIRRHDDNVALTLEQVRTALGSEDSLGGGTIYKAVSKDELGGLRVVEPPAALADRFGEVARPMLELRVVLTHANRQLAATRDLLLPRLVTGRLDISEIDIGDVLAVEGA